MERKNACRWNNDSLFGVLIMLKKLEDIYDALQDLEIKPTPNNAAIMNGVFLVLREIYNELKEKEGANNDGSADSIQ